MSRSPSRTEEVIRRQTEHGIPGTPEGREPVVFVEGRGVILKDIEGKEYIDCFGGYSTANLGHCHPRVVEEVQRQAAKLWHVSWDYYNEPMTFLMEKLATIAPHGLKRTILSNCGAEAIEHAVKLVKKHSHRAGRRGSELVSLTCSFHGRTAMAMGLTGQRKYKVGLSGFTSPGVVYMPAPYCYRCPFGLTYPECRLHCAAYAEDIIKYQTAGDVAAFISEPILGEGGIITPPDEFLPEAVKVFREHGALYIADEVQTGMGRTGKFFGVDWYGVRPDVMVLAKGLASGLPIAATMATEEVASAMDPVDHNSTYAGNAVMCSAALANIEVIIEERLTQHALEVGTKLRRGLEDMAETRRLIGDIRGKGLMLGVELIRDQKTKKPAVEEAQRVREAMRERGVIIGVGGVTRCTLRLQPPLIITEEQIGKVLEALDSSLRSVE